MLSTVCRISIIVATLLILVYGTVFIWLTNPVSAYLVVSSPLPIGHKPCVLRKYPTGFVCVCNATYCDTLDDEMVTLRHPRQMILLTSSAVSYILQEMFTKV